jgi:hypothetical protein
MVHGITLRIDMEIGGAIDGRNSIMFQFTPRKGNVFGLRCSEPMVTTEASIVPLEQMIARALLQLATQALASAKT